MFSGSLSTQLQHRLPDGFFRPLSRPSWPVYVDAADHLLESADEGGQLGREDTLLLLRDVLASHHDLALDPDEGGGFADARQKAAQLYNKLLEAGWLHERRLSLAETWVLVTPALRWTVRLLRELSKTDAADLKDFAATLRSLCRDLLAPPALDPSLLDPETMRQTVGDLIARASRAGDQMHAVENLILEAETLQRTSASAAETLSRFLVDFHAGEHMVCYDALQEGGLVPKLHAARKIIQDATASPLAKERLADGLVSAGKSISPDAAYAAAENLLRQLEKNIAVIPAKQRIIDGRMADFSRLSAQRYRYQTEMRGRHPARIKDYMDEAAVLHEGRCFADLDREPGIPLLAPSVALRQGNASLAPGRRTRAAVDLRVETGQRDAEEEALDAQDAIRRHNMLVVAPQRAARFFDQRKVNPGDTLSTEQLDAMPDDDWLDLLAVLAFDSARRPGQRSAVRWRVHSARKDTGTKPEEIPVDKVAGRRVERLTIERLA